MRTGLAAIVIGFVTAALYLLSQAGYAFAEESTQTTLSEPKEFRTLHFPQDRSLGSVYVQEAEDWCELFYEAVGGYLLDVLNAPAWQRRADGCGQVG